MLWLKSCRRCNGDLFLDWDGYGYFISCLQCGFLSDLSTMDSGAEPTGVRERAAAAEDRAALAISFD